MSLLQRDRTEEQKNQEYLKRVNELESGLADVEKQLADKLAIVSDLEERLRLSNADLGQVIQGLIQIS